MYIKNIQMKKEYRVLYLLAVIKLILPFILQSDVYQPQRDEFLYLAEGHHMAWGFMEIPPLLSVFAWISNLAGSSMFWIKFWPSLFGALTCLLIGKLILSFGGKTLALFLGFLPLVFGAYLRIHFLFQPNFLEIFFWTLISYSLIRYIQSENNSWLYILGIAIGLGMNSKYSVAFFVIALVGGLLCTRQRKIFLNPYLYIAAAIAFLIFLPNLLWQYNRNFPVFVHMKELKRTQLQYVKPSDFLMDQLLMNIACAFIWIAGLYHTIFKQQGKYRAFAWAYLFLITLLLYFQGKSYYSLGVYPVLFAFGAYQLERIGDKRKVWRYVFIIIPFVIGIYVIPLMLPVAKPEALASYYKARHIEKIGFLRWQDLQNHALPQDFADMLGWREMAEKTAKAYATLTPEEKKHTIIFCDNYGQAGAVNYYGKRLGLPVAYSDNASFLYWLPENLQFENLIVVTDDQDEMHKPFIKNFASVTLSDSITNPYAREKGSLIIIMKGANEQLKEMLREKIEADKAKFN
jgi:hypothetical protein